MTRDELTVLAQMDGDFRILIHDSHRLARLLKRFQETEKPLEVTIGFHHRQRSLAQNRWMHGVCVPTVRAWLKETQGEKYTHDEVYYYLNTVPLRKKPEIKEINGEEVITMPGKRWSQKTTKEFAADVEEIVAYFDERGLAIPLPKPRGNNLISEYIKDE